MASLSGSSCASRSCCKVSLYFFWSTMPRNDLFLPTGVNSARKSGFPPCCSKRRKADNRPSSSFYIKAINACINAWLFLLIKPTFCSLRFETLELPLFFCVLLEIYLSAMQHSVCGYNLTMFLLIKPTFCSLCFETLELPLFFCVLLEIYLSAMQHSVCGYNLKTYTFTVYSPLTLVGGYASLCKNSILHSLCLCIPHTVCS